MSEPLTSSQSTAPSGTSFRSIWLKLCGLALVGFVIRMVFALTSVNTHHPDEIFQYLEQAHRLVFGYGFIPWEFRFGARSWLVPLFSSAPLWLCKLGQCAEPSLYIPFVKVIFSLLSVSLIFSSYFIGKNLISEKAGWLAALFCTFWYELVYFSFRPLSDIISGYFLIAALACLTFKSNKTASWLFGICSAIALAIRMQHLPAVIFLFIASLFIFKGKDHVRSTLALMAVAALAGLLDFLTWGQWFASYYNSYLFQSFYGVSNIWGREGQTYFFEAICCTSLGVFPIILLWGLYRLERLWLLTGFVLTVLISHSLISHKEYRFVFAIIPVLLAMTAAATVTLGESTKSQKGRIWTASSAMFVISLLGLYNLLPGEKRFYPYSPLFQSQDNKLAFLFLSKQKDVSAVCVTGDAANWWDSGGYYYLHQDIPIYFVKGIGHGSEVCKHSSHVLCTVDEEFDPDFMPIAKFGQLEVRKRIIQSPEKQLSTKSKVPPVYNAVIFQPGIDDKYVPSVTPRLP